MRRIHHALIWTIPTAALTMSALASSPRKPYALHGVEGNVVLQWNEIALDAIRADSTAPPRAARALAMMHAAMFDAVVAVEGGYEPYRVDANAPFASSEAAAATAAHRVLINVFPSQTETFDEELTNSLDDIADGFTENAGVDLGESVAGKILVLRDNDGSGDTVVYAVGDAPGDWQPTPDAFAAALLPQWPGVTPFCMTRGSQFRRLGPPDLASAEYTTSFDEVKRLGRADSMARTAEQTEIALFWSDGAGTETPPGHWNAIAQDVARSRGLGLIESARLFALLNLALADAAICAWDNKYAYDDWRPVTAIRAADTDANPDTEADPDWTALIATPPFPSYTSGHSTFSGAAAKILALFFEDDNISFETDSDGLPFVRRSYTSFSQAANEAGRSRIYGGIHWEYDNVDGLNSGRELAIDVFDRFLQPAQDGGIASDLCGALGLPTLFALMASTLVSCRRPWRRVGLRPRARA